MSAEPWSARSSKISLGITTDQLMLLDSEDANPATKNKLMTFLNLANSLLIISTSVNTRHVKNQTELEAFLGADLIIPDSTNITVIIDESFTSTKPFKKQAGSSLLLYSQSSNVVLTYTGTGALIQMDNPGVDIGNRTQIDNIILSGNFTNNAFAIEDTSFFTIDLSVLIQFAKVGFLKGMSVIWDKSAVIGNLASLDFINNPFVILNAAPDNTGVPVPLTIFNFISDVETDVIILNSRYISDTADEFLFFDPNSPSTSSYTVKDSGSITTIQESLFQKGVDEAVTAVADNGSGKLRCTSVGHTQVNNTYAVLSGFSESTYNKTALITVIDTDTFDVDDIAFVANDSGNVNRSSLDSTEPRVLARDNPDQKDSMFLAEGRTAGTIEVDSILNTPVAIVDITPVSGDFIEDAGTERFTVNLTTGIITYIGLQPITALISYELNAEKVSGADQNLVISLDKNGVPQTKSDVNLTAPAFPGASVSSNRKIYEIVDGDTFQLFLNNTVNSTNTFITNLDLVISKQ